MNTTPPRPAYRASRPLSWTHSVLGIPADCDIRCFTAEAAELQAQSPQGLTLGVSFFVPSSDFQNLVSRVYGYLGRDMGSCSATVPNTPLPAGLQFVTAFPLVLPLEDDDDGEEKPPVVCGELWTLCPSGNMTASEFESAYNQVMSGCLPCPHPASEERPPLPPLHTEWFSELRLDGAASDMLTCVAKYALDSLAVESVDPNVQLLAFLFARHLLATDMAFSELLSIGPIASMAATALEAWIVPDVFIEASVYGAQDQLAVVLDYEPEPPALQLYKVGVVFTRVCVAYEFYSNFCNICFSALPAPHPHQFRLTHAFFMRQVHHGGILSKVVCVRERESRKSRLSGSSTSTDFEG